MPEYRNVFEKNYGEAAVAAREKKDSEPKRKGVENPEVDHIEVGDWFRDRQDFTKKMEEWLFRTGCMLKPGCKFSQPNGELKLECDNWQGCRVHVTLTFKKLWVHEVTSCNLEHSSMCDKWSRVHHWCARENWRPIDIVALRESPDWRRIGKNQTRFDFKAHDYHHLHAAGQAAARRAQAHKFKKPPKRSEMDPGFIRYHDTEENRAKYGVRDPACYENRGNEEWSCFLSKANVRD